MVALAEPRGDVGLDAPLLILEEESEEAKTTHPAVHFTFRKAFTGVQVFGSTGSGKSSGSGRALALAYLSARYRDREGAEGVPFGGLVLCAKPDEVALWADFRTGTAAPGYCRLAGRSPSDVVVVGLNTDWYKTLGVSVPEEGHRFDFLSYVASLGAGQSTQSLVSLFLTALASGSKQGASREDPFWEDALRQMLTNAIDLLKSAGERLTIENINRIVLSAPQSIAEVRDLAWQERSALWRCLEQANERLQESVKAGDQPRSALLSRKQDLLLTARYWLTDFAGLFEKTRSVIVTSFTAKATAMLRSPMRELFSPADGLADTFAPGQTHQGKVVILDLSIKEHGEAGRFAQILYKTVWQRATEHPSRDRNPNPVFLWADESQYFVTSEDTVFQQTARSKKAATVYLTQNLANYYAVMDKPSVDSLLGNLQTKVFHANSDPTTNSWAESLFGQEKQELSTSGQSVGASAQMSQGTSQQYLPLVPAVLFLDLKRGGAEGVVEAIVFNGGEKWPVTGHAGRKLYFDQDLGGHRLRPTLAERLTGTQTRPSDSSIEGKPRMATEVESRTPRFDALASCPSEATLASRRKNLADDPSITLLRSTTDSALPAEANTLHFITEGVTIAVSKRAGSDTVQRTHVLNTSMCGLRLLRTMGFFNVAAEIVMIEDGNGLKAEIAVYAERRLLLRRILFFVAMTIVAVFVFALTVTRLDDPIATIAQISVFVAYVLAVIVFARKFGFRQRVRKDALSCTTDQLYEEVATAWQTATRSIAAFENLAHTPATLGGGTR